MKGRNNAIPLKALYLVCLTLGYRCNSYYLYDKLSHKAELTINAAGLTEIPFSNQGMTRQVADFVSGGSPPYSISLTVQGGVPTYLIISVNGSTLTLARNTAVAAPANLSGLGGFPNLAIQVTDAAGKTLSGVYALKPYFKRVFVTKDITSFDHNQWHTGGSNNYSACSGGDPVIKANCRCLVAARAKSFPGADQTRAWLSSAGIDASCNLVKIAGKSCTPAQHSGGPWYNMAGNLVATDIGTGAGGLLATSAATNQPLQSAIQYYEDGTSAGSTTVWNGTDPTGIADANNCSNWTTDTTIRYGAVNGINTAGTAPFWNGGSQTCSAAAMGFYCFQAD